MCHIDTQIRSSSNSPASVLELFFVNVNRNICTNKMLQTTSMIQMKMTHYDRFYVFDVVTGAFDSLREFLIIIILCSGKQICQRVTPFLDDLVSPLISSSIFIRLTNNINIFCTASLEKNQTKSGIFD